LASRVTDGRPTRIRSALFVLILTLTFAAAACSPDDRSDGSPAATTVATSVPVVTLGPAAPSTPTPSPSAAPTAAATPVATVEPSPSAGASTSIHRTQLVVIPDPTPVDTEISDSGPASPDTQVPAAAPTPAAFVPPESIDTVDKRLNVTLGGETTYIRNGGRVELGDDLAVEIYLDPYPPTSLHSVVDLYLTQAGEPVTDASIDVEFDMLSMAHGPFMATAKQIGGGHHLATLDYIMFGAWDQFVTIRQGLERFRFPVVIVAYPE